MTTEAQGAALIAEQQRQTDALAVKMKADLAADEVSRKARLGKAVKFVKTGVKGAHRGGRKLLGHVQFGGPGLRPNATFMFTREKKPAPTVETASSTAVEEGSALKETATEAVEAAAV